MKTLTDFKEEVAKEKGYSCFDHHAFDAEKMHDQAAERYADYRYLQGKAETALGHVAMDLQKARTEAWNAALEVASEYIDEYVSKESILKLKK